MKAKTADLIGPALDWAVAKCLGVTPIAVRKNYSEGWLLYPHSNATIPLEYSSKWSQGGPIIEQEWIELGAYHDQWRAVFHGEDGSIYQDGPTPLIAAMRCFVASRLGDEVDIPDELV